MMNPDVGVRLDLRLRPVVSSYVRGNKRNCREGAAYAVPSFRRHSDGHSVVRSR
jgi:hypothetical protein